MKSGRRLNLLVLSLTVVVVSSGLSCCDEVVVDTNSTDAEMIAPGTYTESITHDDLMRTYRIYIPSSYDKTESMPLLIALHGGGGTGEKMEMLTQGGFNTIADKDDFIVVYPDGTKFSGMIKTRWNDGRDERFSQADDVGFISALIEHLAQTLNIDRSRVYATGISNGAQMSMCLARELSDKIAAVAAVAYSMPEKLVSLPVSIKSIPVLVMTGTEDPLIPWEGGETPDPNDKRMLGRILSVPETVEVLVAHNQCSSTPMVTWEPDRDQQDDTRVRREVYGKGRGGSEVILYIVEGGGHAWPGGYQYLSERIVGKASRDIDANEVIWDFFKRHEIK